MAFAQEFSTLNFLAGEPRFLAFPTCLLKPATFGILCAGVGMGGSAESCNPGGLISETRIARQFSCALRLSRLFPTSLFSSSDAVKIYNLCGTY